VTGIIVRRPRYKVSPQNGMRWDLFLICVAALALVSVTRIHGLIPGISAIRPGLLLTAVGLAVYAVQRAPIRRIRALRHPLTAAAFFFLLWTVVTAPFGIYITQSASFLIEWLLVVSVFFVLTACCVRSRQDVSRLVVILAAGGIIFSAAQLAGSSIGGLDPNDSAMLIAAMLPLMAYALVRSPNMLLRIICTVGFALGCAAIVHTGSRGGFLGLATVILYLVFVARPIKPFVRVLTMVLVVAGAGLTATGDYWERVQTIAEGDDGYGRGEEIGGRKNTWARARDYWAANPITGVGVNNFSVAEARHPIIASRIERGLGTKYSTAHSMWFQVAAELGTPGIVSFIAMFILAIVYLIRLCRFGARAPPGTPARDSAELGAALLGSLLAIMVVGTFLTQAYYAIVWGIFGLVIGLFKVSRWDTGSASNGSQALAQSRWRRSVERPAHLGVPASIPAHAAHD